VIGIGNPAAQIGETFILPKTNHLFAETCRGQANRPLFSRRMRRQDARHTHWLRHADHCNDVAGAYQKRVRLLVEFHKMAERTNPEIKELGEGITG